MQIRFYANMRTITGQSVLNISEEVIQTLPQLFEHLISLYPEIRTHLLDESGNLRQDVPIFCNGCNPRLTDMGQEIILENEDVISLFSPISSGRMNVEVLRSSASGEQE
ncbi:MoaD/ThiS family protein [Chloroflexota bacterium]